MKHLVIYSHNVTDTNKDFVEVGTWEYLKLRVNIFKWRKHHTMGRPVLVLRKKQS